MCVMPRQAERVDWKGLKSNRKRKEKYKMMPRPLASRSATRRVWFFPVMCNIARQGRIQMGSCSGSRAVQQFTEERNGVMSQKARLRWLPGLSKHTEN